ncbi:hypothetical protein L204_106113 [Cryptococcus depauperatus]|nr:hypothetical protein L204_05242 [Cryptococcus depauperatus CBS 7855]
MSQISSNPLQRAHALSAKANQLLEHDRPSVDNLKQALHAYESAANLFEASTNEIGEDDSTKGTLRLLTAQHRKLARDLERRISASSGDDAGSLATPEKRLNEGRIPRGHLLESSSLTVSKASPYEQAQGSGLRPKQGQPPAHGVLPFAYRSPSLNARAQTSQLNPFAELSPLHSSSSSSEAAEESYIHFGAPSDTLDPFSRFWARLDNMLEDISNPVAFASAPLDNSEMPMARFEQVRAQENQKKSINRKGKASDEAPSPSGSFYIVPKEKKDLGSSKNDGSVRRHAGPQPKTSEELALENISFRASLDSLASHTYSLEQENAVLKAQLAERDKKFMIAMAEIRKEAGRARQKQEAWKSQLLAGSAINGRIPRPEGSMIGPTAGDRDCLLAENAALKKKVKELEQEVASLTSESEKQKSHIEKYKDRFEKLKANAKAKKEAKLAAAVVADHVEET